MDPQSFGADNRNDVSQPKLVSKVSGHRFAQDSTKNQPPPVKHAEKPTIPTKPTLLLGNASLEPQISAGERVSPFSTPSSSDESVTPDIAKSSRVSEPNLRYTGPRDPRESKHHQPFTAHTFYDAQHAGERAPPPRTRTLDARHLGFTPAVERDLHVSISEDPPGLPPRRGQGQREASGQRYITEDGHNATAARVPIADESNKSQSKSERTLGYLPPPRRARMSISSNVSHGPKQSPPRTVSHSAESNIAVKTVNTGGQEPESTSHSSAVADYPNISNTNRRPPLIQLGATEIETNYDTRLVDICGRYVVTTGPMTKVWDIVSGRMVLSIAHGEREVRVTSLAFKPAATAGEEGTNLWLGTNYGDIQEVHIPSQNVVYVRTGAHERREIIKIHRHQSSMWTLDDGGKLCAWLGDETGMPDLQQTPTTYRVPKGHTFSLVVQHDLWLATGKDIRIFRPSVTNGAFYSVLQEPLNQPSIGAITSGAIIGGQLDRIYFGHADGKVTIYSINDFSCLGVIGVSVYKISCLAGAGFYLWAGYSTGAVHVYDTRTRPWTTKKDWLAHSSPTLNILVDRTGPWKDGVLRVVSLGADNTLRFWDGSLENDWLGIPFMVLLLPSPHANEL